MMTTKICPYCGKLTFCLEYEAHNEVLDDNLAIETEYVCTECHCVFTEVMHYSLHYEDTEVRLDAEGEDK